MELGTSEAAAQQVVCAWAARAGFALLGLTVLEVAVGRRRGWVPSLHVTFGIAMVLVAVYSHAPWEAGVQYVEFEDQLHSFFASIVGFSFIAEVATVLTVRDPRARSTNLAEGSWIGSART